MDIIMTNVSVLKSRLQHVILRNNIYITVIHPITSEYNLQDTPPNYERYMFSIMFCMNYILNLFSWFPGHLVIRRRPCRHTYRQLLLLLKWPKALDEKSFSMLHSMRDASWRQRHAMKLHVNTLYIWMVRRNCSSSILLYTFQLLCKIIHTF